MKNAMRIAIVAALGVAIGGTFIIKCSRSPQAATPPPVAQQPAAAVEGLPAAPPPRPLPRLVDLGADKCVPCRAMAPILEAMRSEFQGRLDVVFIDVWKDRAAGERYGIRVIPTQIFLDAEGRELFRHEGFYSREEILNKWRELDLTLEASPPTGPSL